MGRQGRRRTRCGNTVPGGANWIVCGRFLSSGKLHAEVERVHVVCLLGLFGALLETIFHLVEARIIQGLDSEEVHKLLRYRNTTEVHETSLLLFVRDELTGMITRWKRVVDQGAQVEQEPLVGVVDMKIQEDANQPKTVVNNLARAEITLLEVGDDAADFSAWRRPGPDDEEEGGARGPGLRRVFRDVAEDTGPRSARGAVMLRVEQASYLRHCPHVLLRR
mmetsp:Transcript_38776/g.92807  ORF Transcript_38776/g.92807 Transcript_38776/m.92807 type:complete len:221 (+) Transcript_38776:438-1100(+)